LLNLIKSKLPAKLAEIDAEKADGVVLDVPTDEQYYNSTDFDDRVFSQDWLVRYGLEMSETNSITSATAEDNTYIFLVQWTNLNAPEGDTRKRLFRYSRAFKEILEENFDRFPYMSKFKIVTIAPALWAENARSPVYKVGGVRLKTAIAS